MKGGLHEQVKVHQDILATYKEHMNDIRRYLNSSKFNQDTTVQVGDIMLRLNELDNEIFFKEVQFN